MISYQGASGQIWYELERYPDEVVLVQADYRGGPGTDGDMFTLLHPDEFVRCGFISIGAVPETQAAEIRALHRRRLTLYQLARSTITEIQAKILWLLAGGDRSGRELRTALKGEGIRKSPASFYSMMSKLEDGGFVASRYRPKLVEGVTTQERWYSLTARGVAEVERRST